MSPGSQTHSNKLHRKRHYLTYREKQYAASLETGADKRIVNDGANLTQAQLNVGDVKQARQTLAEIQARVEGLSEDSDKAAYLSTLDQTELWAGEYTTAQPLYEQAIRQGSGHNQVAYRCFLGEAQLRLGQLEQAEQEDIPQLIPTVRQGLSCLALKQRDPVTARRLTDRRIALQKAMDQPRQEEGLLLVQEGRFREALVNTEQAVQALQQARELMQRTGCWRMKDWLTETEELLEYRA